MSDHAQLLASLGKPIKNHLGIPWEECSGGWEKSDLSLEWAELVANHHTQLDIPIPMVWQFRKSKAKPSWNQRGILLGHKFSFTILGSGYTTRSQTLHNRMLLRWS